ncbi:MAG: hypothetical protein ACE5EY_05095 [Anaerolineae bacterium]
MTEAFGGALTGAILGAFMGAILSGAVWCISIGGFWDLPKSGDMAYALTLGLTEGAVFGGLLIIGEKGLRRFYGRFSAK